jgi:hypothetical protein
MASVFSFTLAIITLMVNLIYAALAASGAIPSEMIGIAKLLGYAILLAGLGFNLIALILGIVGVTKASNKRVLGMFGILISTPQILVEAAMLLPLLTGECWTFFCI